MKTEKEIRDYVEACLTCKGIPKSIFERLKFAAIILEDKNLLKKIMEIEYETRKI